MARTKTGALIVIERGQELAQYEDTGEKMDAIVSERLIENIFFKNSPLHDGALLIRRGRATSAACILPVTSRQDLPQQYGLRHRAAFGITERTDAMAVVVSEETGHISVAVGDTMKRVQEEDLAAVLLSAASVA
jgi:DNA integrity scanning protein DisA with diadenylate cyclase activity